MSKMISRRVCVAPMMNCTDRHFRYFARLLTPHSLLYTEMITSFALMHADQARLLAYHPDEQPVAIQLGGSDPAMLAACARIAEDKGYREINLNVGCPSDRVQNGHFGACLMKEPALVAACVAALVKAVTIPVTVKTRIGVDDRDSYEDLVDFVVQVQAAGCRTFIIHARKAWLKGLNPKKNRSIPPLNYERVYQLKRDFPELEIIINGGIKTQQDVAEHLRFIDGVMIGREAVTNPYLLAELDKSVYQTLNLPNRTQVLQQYLEYAEVELAKGARINLVIRPLLGLFHGLPGASQWRRGFSEVRHLNSLPPLVGEGGH